MAQFELSKTWKILGPFPIGSREQDFGADLLENYGGFSQLKYSTTAKFPSELVEGGFVGWSTVTADDNCVVGPLGFTNVRFAKHMLDCDSYLSCLDRKRLWENNGAPFGWSIEQYQAWARGLLVVHEPVQLFIQISGVSEFYLDGVKYHGDCYAYNTTTHIVSMKHGKHHLDVRIVHDVRVFGGSKVPPRCQFQVHLYTRGEEALVYPEDYVLIRPALPAPPKTSSSPSPNRAEEQQQTVCELLMPDYLKDIGFAGSYGCVYVQNAGDETLWVTSLTLCIVDDQTLASRTKNGLFMEYKTDLLMSNELLYLIPGQMRPIGFHFQKEFGTLPATKILRFWVRIGFAIQYDTADGRSEFAVRATSNVRCVDWIHSAFRYTFLDYDNTVHYAMAKRPNTLTTSTTKPVIVALHGAGVEADSEFWTDSVPTQKTSWYILQDERLVSKPYETPLTLKPEDQREWTVGDIEKLIVIGHSNGGQGAWYFATHFSDKVIAAVPVAGYVKIQDYISYANWVGQSYCDPQLKGMICLLQTTIAVLPRLGTEDDNVPPLHTRKYVRILNGILKTPTAIKISEVSMTGHWWDTVFSDRIVQDFLTKNQKIKARFEPDDFSITLMNPAGSGSIHGIQIEQLTIPYRLGKIQGYYSKDQHGKTILMLKTTNIASFRFTKYFRGCNKLTVDEDKFLHLEKNYTKSENVHLSYDRKTKRWKLEACRVTERNKNPYGPVHRMYESKMALIIVIPQKDMYEHAALQIAHDWYLYGRGDAIIVYDNDDATFDKIKHDSVHYCIYLGLINENKKMKELISKSTICNIDIKENMDSTISIRVSNRKFNEAGTGLLLMQPGLLEGEIALIITGTDINGFDSVLQLIPKRTGMMTPEWVITHSSEMKATGLGGILAAGERYSIQPFQHFQLDIVLQYLDKKYLFSQTKSHHETEFRSYVPILVLLTVLHTTAFKAYICVKNIH
ncbi:hypothetical protein BDF20DRAFT_832121 [Mycotypha africana]|uniref:uncharacterized protein n=1 Tax=Mycotypha africana TaxID=64632 RepID=UPI0023000152|nr:uncharacterized protein BDF20DRAFT_832121 [Mycotypha africana]KAI8992141.1 hypothetical protein BDF20DRAFT_832121 [Mycotypha africana]